MNKDSESEVIFNRELTPDIVQKAFENLPSNYVIETQKVLDKWVSDELIRKTYSDRYIIFVKDRHRDNIEIFRALVEVGLQAIKNNEIFGFVKTEKAPSEN